MQKISGVPADIPNFDAELPEFTDIASYIALNSEIVSYGEWIKLNTKQRFEVLEHALIKIYNLKKQEQLRQESQKNRNGW